jgi:phenylalanyl-tRNA synthetase beta subunit
VISGSSKEKRGIIGELHPEVLKRWRLKNPVSCFEICLEDSNNHRGSRGYL